MEINDNLTDLLIAFVMSPFYTSLCRSVNLQFLANEYILPLVVVIKESACFSQLEVNASVGATWFAVRLPMS